MGTVIYDYNKCDGTGDCVEVCPLDLLELSGNQRWCKPKDDKVKNTEAIKRFHEEVENSEHPVDVVIKNDMPDCIQCLVCVTACPKDAISVEP